MECLLKANKITFYKGVLLSDLTDNYIPGTVTKDFKEALMWKERIDSKKSKGAAKHVRHGKSVIIRLHYDESNDPLLSCEEFQRQGVSEHNRNSCWLSAAKVKAQINKVVSYEILTDEQINLIFCL